MEEGILLVTAVVGMEEVGLFVAGSLPVAGTGILVGIWPLSVPRLCQSSPPPWDRRRPGQCDLLRPLRYIVSSAETILPPVPP